MSTFLMAKLNLHYHSVSDARGKYLYMIHSYFLFYCTSNLPLVCSIRTLFVLLQAYNNTGSSYISGCTSSLFVLIDCVNSAKMVAGCATKAIKVIFFTINLLFF